ncbi:helix-turn-helix domain-containing protein [Pseudorhizobium sp. NPDC055634]
MELRERIFRAREDANLTQEQLAAATGKTRGAVSQWEAGDVRPRHSTLVAIAKATGKDLRWLESGLAPDVVGMRVIGEVAAGLWKEGSVEFKPYGQPVAPHPDYPAQMQRLYKVSGNSVNKVVADGEYIHCVSVIDGGISPIHGDLVVVRRSEHGLSEYTAKRLIIEGKKMILRPESHDEQWQTDIEINGDEETAIVITDVVIAKWSPLKRGL